MFTTNFAFLYPNFAYLPCPLVQPSFKMEPKIKLKPRLSTEELQLRQRERLIKERDEMEKRRKAKLLYNRLQQTETEDDEFFEVLDGIKQESEVLEILKWFKAKFEEALKNVESKVNSKTDNFSFFQPEEWKEVFKGENIMKLMKVLEVEKLPENLVIPRKILDFGLVHKISLIEEFINEIIVSSPKLFVCQVCKIKFNVLAQHLRLAKSCKEKYSENELEELNHARSLWKKRTLKLCYRNDKEEKAKIYQEKKSDLNKKYLASRDEATQKMAEYYQKNKGFFQAKNAKYYAKNKEAILKKKAEQYKSKKAKND